MCDTLAALVEGGALFGKNSDRPVGEAQVVEAFDRRSPGGDVRTQYLDVPDPGAFAVVGSRPTWLWGFEHGVNEHRVAIGNEKVWTADNPGRAPDALIGMDLVRLGLERGRTAGDAVDAMTALLERHGQGGLCDQIFGDRYYSSFLVADPTEIWVLETSGRQWAARRTRGAGRGDAISNRLTMRNDFTIACSTVGHDDDLDCWRDGSPTGHADVRLAVTRAAIAATPAGPPRPGDLVATLRHHGDRPWGNPERPVSEVSPVPGPAADFDGRGVSVCMHIRDYSVTTASMVAWLPAERPTPLTVWVALGSPCVSVYVPTTPFADGRASLPELVSSETTWARFDRLRQRAETEPDALGAIRTVLDPLERDWWHRAGAGEQLDDADLGHQLHDSLRQLGV